MVFTCFTNSTLAQACVLTDSIAPNEKMKCMHVCMCVQSKCMYVCMYMYMYTCRYMFMFYALMYAHKYACVCTTMTPVACVRIFVCCTVVLQVSHTRLHTYMHACMPSYIPIYLHACMHTYIHRHVHWCFWNVVCRRQRCQKLHESYKQGMRSSLEKVC